MSTQNSWNSPCKQSYVKILFIIGFPLEVKNLITSADINDPITPTVGPIIPRLAQLSSNSLPGSFGKIHPKQIESDFGSKTQIQKN